MASMPIRIREASARDIRDVVDLYMRLDNPDQKEWIEIMMDGRHPLIDAANFIVAEDTETKEIVASAIYMPFAYFFHGREVKAIRLEEIFCEREYQKQGLMKEILARIAKIAAETDNLFELVFGSNAVYNHLGYAYGIPNEEEGISFLVEVEEEVGEGCFIDEANDRDIPEIAALYGQSCGRNLLGTVIGEKEIDYMKNIYIQGRFYTIKGKEGTICGFFHTQLDDQCVYMLELGDSVSYYQIRPHLINFFIRRGIRQINLKLGKDHPAYRVFGGYFSKRLLTENGFVRVYDIPKLIAKISGPINARLLASPYAHYSGAFTISTHRNDEAFRFVFEDGLLRDVKAVSQAYGDVSIEHNRFIALLFGLISSETMFCENSMFYFANHDLRNIIEIIFPPAQSHVISVN